MRHLLIAALVAASPFAFADHSPAADKIAKAKFIPKTAVVRVNRRTHMVEIGMVQEGLRKGQKATSVVFQQTALNAEKRTTFAGQTASNELDKSTSTASWHGGFGGGYGGGFRGGFRGGIGLGLSFGGAFGGGYYRGGYGAYGYGYGYGYPGYGYTGYGYGYGFLPSAIGFGYTYPYSNCYYGYSDDEYNYGYYGLPANYGYNYDI